MQGEIWFLIRSMKETLTLCTTYTIEKKVLDISNEVNEGQFILYGWRSWGDTLLIIKKYFLHFTYFITIFVKAVCQAVSKPFTSIQSINQSINQSTNQLFFHFCNILHTLGALRHDGKRKGAELGLRHFS